MRWSSAAAVLTAAIALHAPARAASADATSLTQIRADDFAPARGSAPAEYGHGRIHIFTAHGWRPLRWRDRDNYRPPAHPDTSGKPPAPTGYAQIHGGFFEPDHAGATAIVAGGRGGFLVGNHLQLGIAIDWMFRTDEQSSLVSQVRAQDGSTVERRLAVARWSSSTFPALAYIQLAPGSGRTLTPYIGAGGGYEVLYRTAQDYTTGSWTSATYSGWGWQAWAGLMLPISGPVKLTAEVFRNQSTVSRHVDTSADGRVDEMVPLDGAGMRFGLGWAY